MNAKEKANELVCKFTVVGLQQRNEGYQCALIAVDEILDFIIGTYDFDSFNEYYQEVKKEIYKLNNMKHLKAVE